MPPLGDRQCMRAGGENGFNQAIELSADALANVKFVQEKRLISKFFGAAHPFPDHRMARGVTSGRNQGPSSRIASAAVGVAPFPTP